MATTTRPRSRQRNQPQEPLPPPSPSGMAFWQQVAVLATAVITLLSTLVGFATGIFKLSIGGGIFSSPGFWSVYGLLLIVLTATLADFLVLGAIRRRRAANGFGVWAHEAPDGYRIFAHVIWLVLFLPYLFAVGSLALSADPMAAAGVVIVALCGFIGGGEGTGDMAFDIDRTVNPGAYTYRQA